MRVTSKGQVTIPIEIREQLGIHPGTEVEFEVEGNGARLRKVGAGGRGAALVEHLRRHGAAAATTGMSTDEIMALTRGE
jgi:AbrB family looped-hinge helix DNA binding protein